MKIKHGKRQSIKQGMTKITAAKTKAKLRKIAGKIFFRKAMIRAENKRLCIADANQGLKTSVPKAAAMRPKICRSRPVRERTVEAV